MREREEAHNEGQNAAHRVDPSKAAVNEVARVYDALDDVVNSHDVLF